MSKKNYLLLTGILFCLIVKAQTSKTITLNYEFQNFPTTCNTFATAQKVSGTDFEHKTSFGAPGFINLSGRKTLSMTAQNVSASSYRATQYFITYPFKAGNRYKIRIYGKYNNTSTTLLSPRIGIRLNNDANEINTSAACIGPVQKSAGLHLNFSNTIFGPNWGWSSYLYDGLLATDQNYLQILCTPGLDPNSYTNLETAYVGAVQIIEESPAPLIIYPPTSGFEGKFYRNTINGKKFIGMRGKYRQFISDSEMGLNFDLANISLIDITVDPDISLLGDLLTSSQTILYNGEPSDFSSFYIVDEWNNKKYFVEAKRTTFPFNMQTVELHCTDISNPVTFEKYKFKIGNPASSYNVWVFNSSNGYKVDFDGQLHSIGGGASAYYILSPSLP